MKELKYFNQIIIDNDWLNRIEKEICSLGLEIYKLRNFSNKSINNNLNILKNDHNFQFNVELKIKR